MPKNVVVFSDGTGQDGGVRPEQRVSNIYKMYRACRNGPDSSIDPALQVAFYDPGLGTDIGATALTAPVRFVQKLLASVVGRGITANIADCYQFIIDHHEPGDRIFLIGFSRGAYTVRCVANLIRLCGIPTTTPAGPVPRFRAAARAIANEAVGTVFEHGAGHPRAEFEDEREELARRFRIKYGSAHESGEARRSNAAPYFVGVFDTVAALGARGPRRYLIIAGLGLGLMAAATACAILPAAAIAAILHGTVHASFWATFGLIEAIACVATLAAAAWRSSAAATKTIRDFLNPGDVRSHRAEWKGENFDRLLSRFVSYARSANAIDELRRDFDRVGWGGLKEGAPESVDGYARLMQWWFAGNHSDIGGSYAEPESRLSDVALGWMIEQATGIPEGLVVDGSAGPGVASSNPRLRLFPSGAGVQHCEVTATCDAIDARVPAFLRRFSGRWGWQVKVRDVQPDAPVHPTVAERFALPAVQQPGGPAPYRPAALASHHAFSHLYASDAVAGDTSASC